jgi:amino acid permease
MIAIMAYCIKYRVLSLKNRSFVNRGIHADHLPMLNWAGIPLFFGVMTFSMEGIALVLPIKNSMQDQSKGSRFMFQITIGVQALYLVFGLTCALAMGRLTDEIIFHNFGTKYVFIFVIELIYSTVNFRPTNPLVYIPELPIEFFPSVQNSRDQQLCERLH